MVVLAAAVFVAAAVVAVGALQADHPDDTTCCWF